MTTKSVLMVLTSHSDLGNTGNKTGFWVEEFAAPYYAFVDAGIEVTIASPAGGQPPIDPNSELEDFQTDATRRFDADTKAQTQLANSLSLDKVTQGDFDAVFYPGGHGPLWDLTDNLTSIALIESFLAANKPIAAVCHATAAFLNIKEANGDYVVKGKKVTGFSNTEEDAVQLTNIVPFLLEDELIARGANYQKGDDWNVFTLEDGLVISGQNPASSAQTADLLIARI
jgi:putative intracellular protease/amidase